MSDFHYLPFNFKHFFQHFGKLKLFCSSDFMLEVSENSKCGIKSIYALHAG